jgi:hypothetical protein
MSALFASSWRSASAQTSPAGLVRLGHETPKVAISSHRPRLNFLSLLELTRPSLLPGRAYPTWSQVIQLFDSWAHHLSPAQFAEFSLPYAERITRALKAKYPHVPVILHANGGTGAWLAGQAGGRLGQRCPGFRARRWGGLGWSAGGFSGGAQGALGWPPGTARCPCALATGTLVVAMIRRGGLEGSPWFARKRELQRGFETATEGACLAAWRNAFFSCGPMGARQ